MIKYLIADRIKTYLEENLNTGISEKDFSYVNTIDKFNYLKSPAIDGSRVIVFADNPDDFEYQDGRIDLTYERLQKLGINIPAGEIGGGSLWWRRGVVTVQFYGLGKYSQDSNYEAARVAYTMLGRVHSCLDNVSMRNLVDEFGERAVKLFVSSSDYKEAGGNRVNIWEGKLYWQVITERP